MRGYSLIEYSCIPKTGQRIYGNLDALVLTGLSIVVGVYLVEIFLVYYYP